MTNRKMQTLSCCLLLLGGAVAAAASSCPPPLPVGISIKTPGTATTAKTFRTKVIIVNKGPAVLQGLMATVHLPIQATPVKLSPNALAPVGNPWTLVLPALSLRPGKSETIKVKAVVAQGFLSGSFQLMASVALPSDPACAPITASSTVTIKAKKLGKRQLTSSWTQPQSTVEPAGVIVECGQPLPFLPPDFPMGTCADRTTADSRVWGPEAWRMLHVMAQNFPADPTGQAIEGCANFVNSLPFMLPSPLAGFTLAQFIAANNEHDGSLHPACYPAHGMPCTSTVHACLNQTAMVSFFLRAHHAVDTLTKPCKTMWTLQEAAAAYAYEADFCATTIVWGTYPICKEVGETDCGPVTTTPPCGKVAPPAPAPAPPTIAPTQSPTTSSLLIVECGVTLQPSISDWAMGVCGNRSTADPRVFGPFTWRSLHRIAQHYPLAPSAQTQEACVRFLNALPFLIPCPHCGYDFSQFIVANIQNAGTFNSACQADQSLNMPCTTTETACSTRGLLIDFLLRAHHNVDTHNKPCKPLWTRQQAADAYESQPQFCATGIEKGRGLLCRSDGEADCVTVTTEPPCGEL